MDRLPANYGVPVDGRVVPIEVLSPREFRVTVSFLSLLLHDEHLQQALSPDGKILHIEKLLFHDHAGLYTGTRVVKREMSDRNTVPNFVR